MPPFFSSFTTIPPPSPYHPVHYGSKPPLLDPTHQSELWQLRQTGSVSDYHLQFETISRRVLCMSTEAHLECFISGLRDDIACELRLRQPYSVSHAYGLAKQIEANFQFDLHWNELRPQMKREIPKLVTAAFASVYEKRGSSSQTLDSDLDSDDDFVVNPESGIIAKPDSAFLDNSVCFAVTEDRKKFVPEVFTDLGLSIPAPVHSVLVPRVLDSNARFNPQLLPEQCVSLPPTVLTVTTQSVRHIPATLNPRDTPPPAPPDKFAIPPLALPPKPPDPSFEGGIPTKPLPPLKPPEPGTSTPSHNTFSTTKPSLALSLASIQPLKPSDVNPIPAPPPKPPDLSFQRRDAKFQATWEPPTAPPPPEPPDASDQAVVRQCVVALHFRLSEVHRPPLSGKHHFPATGSNLSPFNQDPTPPLDQYWSHIDPFRPFVPHQSRPKPMPPCVSLAGTHTVSHVFFQPLDLQQLLADKSAPFIISTIRVSRMHSTAIGHVAPPAFPISATQLITPAIPHSTGRQLSPACIISKVALSAPAVFPRVIEIAAFKAIPPSFGFQNYSNSSSSPSWSQVIFGLLVAARLQLISITVYMKLLYKPVVGPLKVIALAYATSFAPTNRNQDSVEKFPNFIENMIYSRSQVAYMAGRFALEEEAKKGSEINSVRWCMINLVFVGVVNLRNFPRKGIHKAIEDWKQGAIEVMVLTVEPQSTAAAYCREFKLLSRIGCLLDQSLQEHMQLVDVPQSKCFLSMNLLSYARGAPTHLNVILFIPDISFDSWQIFSKDTRAHAWHLEMAIWFDRACVCLCLSQWFDAITYMDQLPTDGGLHVVPLFFNKEHARKTPGTEDHTPLMKVAERENAAICASLISCCAHFKQWDPGGFIFFNGKVSLNRRITWTDDIEFLEACYGHNLEDKVDLKGVE